MKFRNIAKCRKCKTVIESKYRHDFVWCACKSIYVDGGTDYCRMGGNPEDFEEIDVTEGVDNEST